MNRRIKKPLAVITAAAVAACIFFAGDGLPGAKSAQATGIVCAAAAQTGTHPEGWDAKDPEWEKHAAKQKTAEMEENRTVSASAASIKASAATLSTTWPLYTNSKRTEWSDKTFYHADINTENATVLPAIDVSKWDEDINWSKVKKDGIKAVIIRAAYRSYSDGGLYVDPYFEENMKGAQKAGLKVGCYIFSQALTKKEAVEEAEFLLNTVKGYSFELPLVFDYEYVSGGRAKKSSLTKKERTAITLKFMETIEKQGYTAMQYASSNFLVVDVNGSSVAANHPIWLARYADKFYVTSDNLYYGRVFMWQCSSTAKVSGIDTMVDLDYWYMPDGFKSMNEGIAVREDSVTSNTLNIKWNAAYGASGYRLYYTDKFGASYTKVDLPADTTTYTLTGLKPNTQYYFKIRSFITEEDGTTVYAPLSGRTVLKTSSLQSQHVRTIASVKMHKKPGTSYAEETTLAKGTGFKIKAFTYDKSGSLWYKGTSGSHTGYVQAAKCGYYQPAVSSLKQSAVKATAVRLSWKEASGADLYRIYRSAAPNGSYKKIGETASLSYENTGLKSGYQYYYKVIAVQKNINSKKTYTSSVVRCTAHTKKFSAKYRAKKSVYMRSSAGKGYAKKAAVLKGAKIRAVLKTKDKKGNVWYYCSYKIKRGGKKRTYRGYVPASAFKKIK